jgi:DNA polymerase-3 subunit delta'
LSWKHILGHDRVRTALERVWRRGRLAHAYLFAGSPGIGKRLFAMELAKALLCERASPGEKATLAACDECPDCKQIAAGAHPDLHVAGRPEESNELPIEVMQEFCQNFRLKSARGRGKIAILDDADDLNEESANCFLKTLEEPPPRSMLILIGTAPERQLATITSRSQIVRFAPLPEEQVVAILRQHEMQDARHAHRLARLSGGSPGVALAHADPALWQFRRTLLNGLAASRVNSVAIAKDWIEFVDEAGKESAQKRQRAAQVLRLLIQMIQDALAIALGAEPRENDPEDLKLLTSLAQRVGIDRLLEVQERCLEADMQIDRYVQLSLVLEALTDAVGKRVTTAV